MSNSRRQGESGKSVEEFSPLHDSIHEVRIALVLVLQDVVEGLEEQGHVDVVTLGRVEEPRRHEELEEVDQLYSRNGGEHFAVGTDVADDGEEAVVQGRQPVYARHDELVKSHHQQISM